MGLPLIGAVGDIVDGLAGKFFGDKEKRDAFKHEFEMAATKAGLAQIDVNKTEAAHKSIFVAGWRPFVGWVCGLALLWHFILYDALTWAVIVFVPDAATPPTLMGTDTLITVLFGMLGLGGLRTFEKINGVAREK